MGIKKLGKLMLDLVLPIFLYLLAASVIQIILIVLMSLVQGGIMDGAEWVLQHSVETSAVSALFTMPFLIWLGKKQGCWETKAQQKASIKAYGILLPLSISLVIWLNLVLMMSGIMENSEAYQEATSLIFTPSFPIQIICVGITVPIMEELIFRGLIYRRLRKETSIAVSVLVSALIFGIYHGNIVQFIYAFLVGIVLACSYEYYHSLAAPILIHIFMNTTSCSLTEWNVFGWLLSHDMILITATIAMIAVSGFSLVIMWKMLRKY